MHTLDMVMKWEEKEELQSKESQTVQCGLENIFIYFIAATRPHSCSFLFRFSFPPGSFWGLAEEEEKKKKKSKSARNYRFARFARLNRVIIMLKIHGKYDIYTDT